MRELTKSVISCTWALSLWSMKQAASLLSGFGGETPIRDVGSGFDSVTQSAVQQMGDSLGRIFQSGDNIQRASIDMLMNFAAPMRAPCPSWGAPPPGGGQQGAGWGAPPQAGGQPGASWGAPPPGGGQQGAGWGAPPPAGGQPGRGGAAGPWGPMPPTP